ncbi:P-loop NTPase [Dictyoglomus turgidum]|uniref:P-loop NTPase n=1 Tax=Dictyoglomus turgidum TaxID=513050 RepID=UPI000CCEB431|nr:P-loop NTPase [Dictyoglomus turgidum]PNV78785.1 MAG: ATP-binding protein [Dictyoglomus turgidum]
MTHDPRLSIIDKRLESVKNIIAIGSGKGGVGKSTFSSLLSLFLNKKGYKIGLLDLDIYGPSNHVILNAEDKYPEEEYGLKPVNVNGIDFMSIIYFTQNKPLIMRGKELTDTILEIFAITRWRDLDYLIIDMPPGMGEVLLDLIRFIKNLQFLIITNPTKIALETVEKLINFLKEGNYLILGLVENMKIKDDNFVKEKCQELNIKYLGHISFYENIEENYGNIEKLINPSLEKELNQIVSNFIQKS